MEKSKVKCPKCKSVDLELIEIWRGHTITWQQENGTFVKKEGNIEMGDPYKVVARCDCGHQWKIKGAIQIDNIII